MEWILSFKLGFSTLPTVNANDFEILFLEHFCQNISIDGQSEYETGWYQF